MKFHNHHASCSQLCKLVNTLHKVPQICDNLNCYNLTRLWQGCYVQPRVSFVFILNLKSAELCSSFRKHFRNFHMGLQYKCRNCFYTCTSIKRWSTLLTKVSGYMHNKAVYRQLTIRILVKDHFVLLLEDLLIVTKALL